MIPPIYFIETKISPFTSRQASDDTIVMGNLGYFQALLMAMRGLQPKKSSSMKLFEWEDNPQMEFVGHFQFPVVCFLAVLGCGRSIMCQHNDISHSDIHPN